VLKSVCIKTNNKNIINYLLEDIENLNIGNTYFSIYKFKIYNNIIIHYAGKNKTLFLTKLSYLLTNIIIDFYETIIMRKLIFSNYFYFSSLEQKQILNLCIDTSNNDNLLEKTNLLSSDIFEYLIQNKTLNLDGLINFRIPEYIKFLDSIVDLCVNKFVIDREYLEFINMLKIYINSKECSCDEIHLVYRNHESVLLDENYKTIQYDDSFAKAKFLSDVSFSSNDFALNSLLTLLPEKLYIHLIDVEDEFINTLKLIFDDKVCICKDCNICTIYKNYSNVGVAPLGDL